MVDGEAIVVKAARLALPVRPRRPLAQDQKSARAGGAARARRRMGPMTDRRFPPPWTVEETQPCFIVRDHNGQALAFVYCEDEVNRRTTAKMLTRDMARRIAAN
jgi:hypothetical protein